MPIRAVAVLLFLAAAIAARGTDAPEVLLEMSWSGFGDGGSLKVIPAEPPRVQFLRSGEVRFHRDGAYWKGMLDVKAIAKFKNRLERQPLLAETRFMHTRRGGPIGMHGGAWWIRYLRDDGQEVLVVSSSVPRLGPLARLAAEVWRRVPADASTFVPPKMMVIVSAYSSFAGQPSWPFSDRFRLARWPAPVELTDAHVIAFLNSRADQRIFGEDDGTYFLHVVDVPGWFPSLETRTEIEMLFLSATP